VNKNFELLTNVVAYNQELMQTWALFWKD